MTAPATVARTAPCTCAAPSFATLVACECEGAAFACPRCAGTGARPGDSPSRPGSDGRPTPCPTHAPHDYRMWMARGRPIASAAEASASTAGGSRATVAILSNDPAVLTWGDSTLAAAGFRVVVADACRARVTLLAHGPPDVLLIDLDGAEPDGLALVRRATAAVGSPHRPTSRRS